MDIQPITPDQVHEVRKKTIPSFVLQAFNELIVENMQANGISKVYQEDAICRMLKIEKEIVDSNQIFNMGWLNIECIYQDAGWKVEYDKPAYNETYRAFFTFIKKRA
jgi:hypothetical protein